VQVTPSLIGTGHRPPEGEAVVTGKLQLLSVSCLSAFYFTTVQAGHTVLRWSFVFGRTREFYIAITFIARLLHCKFHSAAVARPRPVC